MRGFPLAICLEDVMNWQTHRTFAAPPPGGRDAVDDRNPKNEQAGTK